MGQDAQGQRTSVEQAYAEAAEEFRRIVEARGVQSPEAVDKAAELRERLAAYVQSLA